MKAGKIISINIDSAAKQANPLSITGKKRRVKCVLHATYVITIPLLFNEGEDSRIFLSSLRVKGEQVIALPVLLADFWYAFYSLNGYICL